MFASRASRTAQGGFTLLELLVVIAVLGVLGGASVLAVSNLSDRASDATCDADAQALRTAQQARATLEGSFGDEAALVSGGYLRDESQLHDIVLVGDGYELVPVASCAQRSTTELADADTADEPSREADPAIREADARAEEAHAGDATLDAAPTGTGRSERCAPEQVDINAASAAELTKIVHIGQVRAEHLIKLRPFSSVEDMKRIPGIADARVKDISKQGLACV